MEDVPRQMEELVNLSKQYAGQYLDDCGYRDNATFVARVGQIFLVGLRQGIGPSDYDLLYKLLREALRLAHEESMDLLIYQKDELAQNDRDYLTKLADFMKQNFPNKELRHGEDSEREAIREGAQAEYREGGRI